jgi:hypothetical protein
MRKDELLHLVSAKGLLAPSRGPLQLTLYRLPY